MADRELKPDRWYLDITINDERTGVRRSVNTYLPDDGNAAKELLEMVMGAAISAGLGTKLVDHMRQVTGGVTTVRMECPGGHEAEAELERIVSALDGAGFGHAGAPAHLRVIALLAQRDAATMPARPEAGPLPRTLVEPEGDDPANDAVEWIDGRPVRDVGLPVDGGGGR